MHEYQGDPNLDRLTPTPALDELVPPLSPAPMPRQNLVFLTPRVALRALVRPLKELRRPQRAVRRATIPVPAADEPR